VEGTWRVTAMDPCTLGLCDGLRFVSTIPTSPIFAGLGDKDRTLEVFEGTLRAVVCA
jgi:hypothetical protein